MVNGMLVVGLHQNSIQCTLIRKQCNMHLKKTLAWKFFDFRSGYGHSDRMVCATPTEWCPAVSVCLKVCCTWLLWVFMKSFCVFLRRGKGMKWWLHSLFLPLPMKKNMAGDRGGWLLFINRRKHRIIAHKFSFIFYFPQLAWITIFHCRLYCVDSFTILFSIFHSAL